MVLFPNVRGSVVGKGKEKKLMLKKKTEKDKSPECFMFPCGLATCLPYQNCSCLVLSSMKYSSILLIDSFYLNRFYLDFFPLHPVMPSKVCVQLTVALRNSERNIDHLLVENTFYLKLHRSAKCR